MRFDRKRLLLWLMVAFTATPVTVLAQGSAYPPGPGSGGGTSFTGGAITAPILGPAADNCLAPPYSFTGDATSGVCSSATAVVVVRTSGANRLSISTTAITSTLPVLGPSGTVGAPSFTFSTDTSNDTGLYRIGENSLGISSGGTNVATINATSSFLQGGGSSYVNVQPTLSILWGQNGTTSTRVRANSFTLGSPVIDFEVIDAATSSNRVVLSKDKTEFDVGAAAEVDLTLTDSLLTSTVPFIVPAGTAAAPSVGFTGATTTGLYSAAPGIGFAVAGASVGTWSATALTSSPQILGVLGTQIASAQQYAFSSGAVGAASDAGLARSAAGIVKVTDGGAGTGALVANSVTTGGVNFDVNTIEGSNQGLRVKTGGLVRFVIGLNASAYAAYTFNTGQWGWTSASTADAGTMDTGLARVSAGIVKVTDGGSGNGSIRVASGTVGDPSYSFVADPDTGLWLNGASNLAASVANSAVWNLDTAAQRMKSDAQVNWSSGDPSTTGADVGLVRNALGQLRVSNGGAGLGYFLPGQAVEANTTTKAPAITESGELYTNTGDADGSIINLPNDPTIGTQYLVVATVAQDITLAPAAGESIMFGNTTCGTSFVIGGVATGIGDSVTVVAATGGSGAVWITTAFAGTPVCTP
jgi:hypothetical protein